MSDRQRHLAMAKDKEEITNAAAFAVLIVIFYFFYVVVTKIKAAIFGSDEKVLPVHFKS